MNNTVHCHQNDMLNVDYENPLSLVEQQNIMMEMLYEFDDYCKKNDINYYLIGGTLLGAIRHNGFIPWDDDVDVAVPRKDFEKLMLVSSIGVNTDVVSYRSEKYYHPFSHINLVDKRTIRVSDSTRIQTGQGLFVDIFPLDILPDDRFERTLFINKIRNINRLIGYSIKKPPEVHGIKGLVKRIAFSFSQLIDPLKYVDRENAISKKFANSAYSWVGIVKFTFLQWPKECFEDTTLWQFGKKQLVIPKQYDKVLTMHYGDYMTPPPENERVCRHPAKVYWRKNRLADT